MLKFEQEKYVLKITDESYGFLTMQIKQRPKGNELYTVRFLKKRPKGVVYNFHTADRLDRLYIEENIFHDLMEAAK
jgi:TATA-binding protein-associated factor Taf7